MRFRLVPTSMTLYDLDLL